MSSEMEKQFKIHFEQIQFRFGLQFIFEEII